MHSMQRGENGNKNSFKLLYTSNVYSSICYCVCLSVCVCEKFINNRQRLYYQNDLQRHLLCRYTFTFT